MSFKTRERTNTSKEQAKGAAADEDPQGALGAGQGDGCQHGAVPPLRQEDQNLGWVIGHGGEGALKKPPLSALFRAKLPLPSLPSLHEGQWLGTGERASVQHGGGKGNRAKSARTILKLWLKPLFVGIFTLGDRIIQQGFSSVPEALPQPLVGIVGRVFQRALAYFPHLRILVEKHTGTPCYW